MLYLTTCLSDEYFHMGASKIYLGGSPVEVDFTYNEGKFYPDHLKPICKYDLKPLVPDCEPADIRNLAMPDETFRSAVVDLPYTIQTGKGYKMKERFGQFADWEECYSTHQLGIREVFRVLKPLGYLFIKVQDGISGGKTSDLVGRTYTYIMEAGFDLTDRAYRVRKEKMPNPNQSSANQQHFANNVCVWYVCQKPYST